MSGFSNIDSISVATTGRRTKRIGSSASTLNAHLHFYRSSAARRKGLQSAEYLLNSSVAAIEARIEIASYFESSATGARTTAARKKRNWSSFTNNRGAVVGENDKTVGHGVHVVSIFEDKPKKEIGLAALDLRTYKITIQQFSDTTSLAFTSYALQQLDPIRVVIPKIFGNSGPLQKLLRDDEYPDKPDCITEIARRYFDDSLGEEILRVSSCSDFSELQSKRCGLACLAALLRFIGKMEYITREFHQEVLLPSHSLDISYKHLENFLIMDLQASHQLQIVRSQKRQGTQRRQSLLSSFVCETLGGARLLRQNLLNPLTSIDEIQTRLESVEFLIANEQLSGELSSVLAQFQDVDVVLSRFTYKPNKKDEKYYKKIIKSALQLRDILVALNNLYALLETATRAKIEFLGDKLRSNIDPALTTPILEAIIEVFDDDILSNAPAESLIQTEQKLELLYAVKKGRNAFLDIARDKYKSYVQKVNEYEDQLKLKNPILNLHIEHSESKGYVISYPAKHDQDVPKEFVWRCRKGQKVSCSTHHLASLNAQMKDVRAEIFEATYMELESFINIVEENLRHLHFLADCVSSIDMLIAFACFAVLHGPCVKPNFSSGPKREILIKQGRNPLIQESISQFVPFDYHINQSSKCQTLTAPNGAGKSTYLKTLGILIILAQSGCFVPAEQFQISIIERLLTHFGPSDDRLGRHGSFAVSMKQLAHLQHHITNNTLILMDELETGTSYVDGLSICWAAMENILSHSEAFCILSTHYSEMIQFADLYHEMGARNISLECGIGFTEQVLQPAFRVMIGPSRINKGYGLLCAKATGFPQSLVDDARTLSIEISKNLAVLGKKATEGEKGSDQESNIIHRAAERLRCLLKNSSLTDEMLRSVLIRYQKQVTNS